MHRIAPLNELPLSARDQACCRRAGLRDAGQVVCTPTADLRKAMNGYVDADGVSRIQRAAFIKQAPKLVSVLDLMRQTDKTDGRDEGLSSGDKAIDDLLGTGFAKGALTEIAGQSAMGKTQIALQTAVIAALALDVDATALDKVRESDELFSALHGTGIRPSSQRQGVVIVTFDGIGEAHMILRRMQEMSDAFVEHRWHAHRNLSSTIEATSSSTGNGKRKGAFAPSEKDRASLCDVQQLARTALLKNVHLATIKDYGMLLHLLEYGVPKLMEKVRQTRSSDIGLVVVDDVTVCIHEAAEKRAARMSEMVVERSRLCCELSDALKALAAQPLAVIVINHVVDLSDRHKDLLRKMIEDELNGLWDDRRQDNKSSAHLPTSTMQDKDRHSTPRGQETALHLAFQELYFAGISGHVHRDALVLMKARLRRDLTNAQLIDGHMSDLRMTSMGLSWVNSINVRLVLTRTCHHVVLPQHHRKRLRDAGLRGTHTFGVRRAVSVLNPFSYAGNEKKGCVDYIISTDGVRSLRSLQIEDQITPEDVCHPDEQREDDRLWGAPAENESLHEDEMLWLTQMEAFHHADPGIVPSSSSSLSSFPV